MNDVIQLPVIRALVRLASSSKFYVLLFGALASYGLDVSDELKVLVILVAVAVFSASTAYEDGQMKRAIGESSETDG